MNNSDIKILKPLNKEIAKFVNFYYEYELNNESYFAFPTSNNIVALINGARVNFSSNLVEFTIDSNVKNTFIGLNKYTKPLKILSDGRIKEFVINFSPAGLAQFLKTNFYGIDFFEIVEFDNFIESNPSFFNYASFEKVSSFEQYLLTILDEKKELNIVLKSIDLIKFSNFSIEEIAKQCNCSYKKLYRLFKIHCMTTPSVIKKNLKFREALKKLKSKNGANKISDIAIDLGYYDQPFFNKSFKKSTGETPNLFFKDSSKIFKNGMFFKNLG